MQYLGLMFDIVVYYKVICLVELTSSVLAPWPCRAFCKSSTCCCSSVTLTLLNLEVHQTHRKYITVKPEVKNTHTAYLLSVSSSEQVLCATSSSVCSSEILSFSDPSCCTRNILFSCWSRINFSLYGQGHTQLVQSVSHTQNKQLLNYYLYSTGRISAARLSWVGLPAGIPAIPVDKQRADQ